MQQELNPMDPSIDAASERGTIRFGDYLRRAWRRKFLVIVPSILMLTAGFLYIRHDMPFSTPRYKSEAIMEERLPQATAEVSGEEMQRFSRTERETFFSMVYRIRSRVSASDDMAKLWEKRGLIDPNRPLSPFQRLARAMRVQERLTREEIKGAQITELADHLKADPSDTARIFVISFEAPDRSTAQEVVRRATELYVKSYDDEVATLGRQSEGVMEVKLADLKKELEKIKYAIIDFRVTNPGVDPLLIDSYTKRYETAVNKLTTLESDLVGYESDRRIVVLRLKATKMWQEGQEPTNPLKEEIKKLEAELQSLKTGGFTSNHPDYKRVQNELNAKKAALRELEQIEKEKENKPVEVQAPVRTEADVYRDNRRLLEAELDYLNNEKRKLHAERNDIYNKYTGDPTMTEKTKKELQDNYEGISTKIYVKKQMIAAKEGVLDALVPGSDLAALRNQFKDAPVDAVKLENLPKIGVKGGVEGAAGGPRLLSDFTSEELQRLTPEFIELASEREKLIRQAQQTMNEIDIASEELRRVAATLDRFSVKAVDLENLRKDEEDLNKRIEFITEKLYPIGLRKDLEESQLGRRLVVLRPASLPADPSWPPPWYLILPISFLVGAGMGLLIITALELLDHSFWRSDMIEEKLRLPVLATIPLTPVDTARWPGDAVLFRPSRQEEAELAAAGGRKKRFSRRMLKRLRRRTVATEQFRKLRLRLISGYPAGKAPRTILVTSSIPEEGKTMVASNLAAAISQRIGEHVLLVDCDLRRPSVHTFFNVKNGLGLADYLQQKADLPQLLVKTSFDKLTILPAGNSAATPAEMLASDRMKNLVKEMKSRYADRIIIFDSPPVLATADPNVIASQVDGILLVVEAGRTPQEIVETSLSSLEDHNVIGAVLNAAKYEITEHFYPRDGEYD